MQRILAVTDVSGQPILPPPIFIGQEVREVVILAIVGRGMHKEFK